ncbi:MAG: hypothetical protein JWP32_2865 [Schumannella sp.]|nr:hypothetical protein [Schumannella sp.]
MIGTRHVFVRVREDDVPVALTLLDGGFEARVNHDWDASLDPGIAVIRYSVFYGPQTDDPTMAHQMDDQVRANLSGAGIWYEYHGNAVEGGRIL